MDSKFDYFIKRTDEDLKAIEDKMDAAFIEINQKLDALKEWKIKVDAKTAVITSVITVVLNLVFIYFGAHH